MAQIHVAAVGSSGLIAGLLPIAVSAWNKRALHSVSTEVASVQDHESNQSVVIASQKQSGGDKSNLKTKRCIILVRETGVPAMGM